MVTISKKLCPQKVQQQNTDHQYQQHYINQTNKMLSSNSRAVLRVLRSRRSAAQPAIGSILSKRSYHENIVEHYENPRNVGSLDKNESSVGTVGHHVSNSCSASNHPHTLSLLGMVFVEHKNNKEAKRRCYCKNLPLNSFQNINSLGFFRLFVRYSLVLFCSLLLFFFYRASSELRRAETS